MRFGAAFLCQSSAISSAAFWPALCGEGLRKITIEPVFGQYNRRVDQFMRRGRAAVQSELRVAATHNMLKLHNHWIANTA